LHSEAAAAREDTRAIDAIERGLGMIDEARAARTPAPSDVTGPSRPPPGALWTRSLEWLPAGVAALVVLVVLVRPEPFPDDGGLGRRDRRDRSATATGREARTDATAVAPAPSASGRAATDALADVAALRAAEEALAHRLRINDLKGAVAAFEHLATQNPAAAADPTNRERIADLAVRVMFLPGNEPDRVYARLSTGLGAAGLDVLYLLATTKGGSRAATQATRLLDDPALLAGASPAMRVAWELWRSKDCEAKRTLFGRAAEHGDWRVLGQLQALSAACGRSRRRNPEACCFDDDADLASAIQAIRARVAR
jgi:hypothetical protein